MLLNIASHKRKSWKERSNYLDFLPLIYFDLFGFDVWRSKSQGVFSANGACDKLNF